MIGILRCMIGNCVKFLHFVLLATSDEAKTWLPFFSAQCIIKQLSFSDIQNNQGLGKGLADNAYLDLDYSGCHNNLIQLFKNTLPWEEYMYGHFPGTKYYQACSTGVFQTSEGSLWKQSKSTCCNSSFMARALSWKLIWNPGLLATVNKQNANKMQRNKLPLPNEENWLFLLFLAAVSIDPLQSWVEAWIFSILLHQVCEDQQRNGFESHSTTHWNCL